MPTPTERITLFADVIVPVPVPGLFTYRVPFELNSTIETGKRVVVQFGKKKVYAGIVRRVHQEVPSLYTPKYILGILDNLPIVNTLQLDFWDWMTSYYMCHTGEVVQAALPTALRLASETKIVLADGFVPDAEQLSESEFLVTEALIVQQNLTISEVSKIVGFQKVMPLITGLIDRHIVLLEEELAEKFKARTEQFVSLSEAYRSEDALKPLMDELSKRAFKQLEIVMSFLALTRFPVTEEAEAQKKLLLNKAGASHVQLKSLVDKGVFVLYDKVVSRLPDFEADSKPESIVLSDVQQAAYDGINSRFLEKDVVLLHGVTSSGKTEIYIKQIHEAIEAGKQVLYLLPEIALTTQIIHRLKKYFGNKVGVYHSRYNPFEKVEIWNKVLQFTHTHSSDHQVILGPRSAIFLPFSNLGLIIVDEEHDQSFKQFEPAPRYHARDAAIMLAKMSGAKIILGSATPAVESYFNAESDKYGLVKLTERFGGMELPEVTIVNLKEEVRRKKIRSHFSEPLLTAITDALKNNEQAILFQNRRGFSLRLECDQCNYVPQCKNCDVSLIYHKKQELLRCHYCGYSTVVPAECPDCKSTAIKMHGFGTEKVEEELGLLLPKARIARLDLDTTRSKFAFQSILEEFEAGKIDILAGTQMVTKGLDFGRVRVVGVLNADNMLSYPDFRAFERSFQLMAQVSGRAGRKNQRGQVFIQTFQPGHPLLQDVVAHRYENMYTNQLGIRHHYHYPPYYRLILIRLKHRDEQLLNLAAAELALALKKEFPREVLGPEYPMVSRIKNLYIKQIIIKIHRNASAAAAKSRLSQMTTAFFGKPAFKSVLMQIDVDPFT